MLDMTKQDVLDLLGGEVLRDIARELGVSTQAVWSWKDPLSHRIEDRVITHLWRVKHPRAPERRKGRALLAA